MHTSKAFYIVTLLVGSLVLAISVGLVVWHLKPEETIEHNLCYPETISNSSKEISLQNFHHGLVIKNNDRNILIYDPHQNLTVNVLSLQSGHINDYDVCMNKTLWYSVKDSLNKPVSSISADYPDLMPPDLSGNATEWDATAIAVDFRTEKVYVYDNESMRIDIFDMQGKNRGILLTEIAITDIALDPYKATIFMLSPTEITKANMDGSFVEYQSGVPFLSRYKAFVVDYKAGALIVTDGKNVVNYGVAITSIHNQVMYSSKDIDITSMAILGEHMYFIMKSLDSSISILISCAMPRCFHRMEYKELLVENPQKVKAFDTFEPLYQENPCEHLNGDCDHFCVLARNHRRRSCACKLGWQLDDDHLSCKPVKEYIIFVRGRYIRSKISSVTWHSFSEAVAMKRLPDQVSMSQRSWIHFDYNAHKNYLIFNDDQSLYRLDMINYAGNVELLEDGISYEVRPIVDWISDNIYFIRPNNYSGNYLTFIMVRDSKYRSNFTGQKVVQSFDESMKPRALAIHPNRGLIFVALYNAIAGKGQIYRMYTDGSHLTKYTLEQQNASVNETILKVDWATDRLYWLSEDKKEVQHAALDGSDLKVFKIPFAKDPMEINIHRDWLYISERKLIWRVHKRTGEFEQLILVSFPNFQEMHLMSAAAGFGRELQPIRDDHPCLYKNGGCSRYCFALPLLDSKLKRACGCNNNEKLVEQNRCDLL